MHIIKNSVTAQRIFKILKVFEQHRYRTENIILL